MSRLAVNQLQNNDSVDIKVRLTESKTLHTVRLKLLKYGVINDGLFKLEIMDGLDVLATSKLTPSDFALVTGTFAHGYFKFELPYPVRINHTRGQAFTEITFRLSVSSHTDSDTNYIALIKQHEFKFVDEFGSYPASAITPEERAWQSPYGIELYTYSNN